MKKTLMICSAAVLMGGLAACSDFLEEYSQDSYYARSWEDLDELLVGACYLQVGGTNEYINHSNIGQFLHMITDEVEENNSGYNGALMFDDHERLFGFYTWQQRTGQNESYTEFYSESEAWTQCYYYINVANNILAGLESLTQTDEASVEGMAKVRGEAHFLRAWYYFWLVNLYADPYHAVTAATDPGVPLKLSPNVEDRKFERNTVQEVYDVILSDLDVAEEELGKLTTSRKSIYRADSTSVNLLRSRVCLYMQDWETAAAYARRAMNGTAALENLNSGTDFFLRKGNPENIFSMGGDDIPCMFYYGYQGFRVSREFYGTYDKDDLRRSRWFWTNGAFIGPTKAPDVDNQNYPVTSADYYNFRYFYGKQGNLAEVSSLFLLRVAEAYLNYAEAEACLGNEEEAREALRSFRTARYPAGSARLEETLSGEELVAAVREERGKEFVLEGHRWFDLRRYQVCDAYPYAKTLVHDYTYYADRSSATMTECHRFTLEPGDGGYTLPIPQSVIEFNTGMVNNVRPWREYTVVPLKDN